MNVSMHYVSQEVKLDEASLELQPYEHLLNADVERRLLLEEAAQLDALGEMSEAQQKRHGEVLEQLDLIGAESAPRRAAGLLD